MDYNRQMRLMVKLSFATAEVAYITAMIFIHIILHSTVHIYDFHIFITLSAELFTSTERVLTQRSNFTPRRANVVPKSLSKTKSSAVCSSLLPDTSKLESAVILPAEEFLPGTSLLLNAERKDYLPSWWRKIRSISSHLHLFANRQKEYPGYQRFFSRAVTIKTWQKSETALEKSLAPRVQIEQPNT